MKQVITLYHRASAGGIKVWTQQLEDDGKTITTRWGIFGNKLQETKDTQTSRGKEGTKAFKSPEQVAQEQFDRKVKKKRDEGYVDDVKDVRDSVHADTATDQKQANTVERVLSNGLDFNNPPKEFAPAKPVSSIDIAAATRLEQQGKLIKQRKRDGMRHFMFIGDQKVSIFSRRMENVTSMFPSYVQALTKAAESGSLPRNTVLDAEFTVSTYDENDIERDDFAAVASICRSADKKAIERQRYIDNSFMVFDLLYLDGNPVYKLPYRQRHDALTKVVKAIGFPQIDAVENLTVSLSDAIDIVGKEGWEGLVVWNGDEGTVVQLNGKPKRVNCFKLKPELEDDFVATGYELGTGRLSTSVGALFISQYRNGQLVEVGKVGTGFDNATREDAVKWQFPSVVQVKFAERTPDGSLRFPVFVRRRTDKAPEECVA